MAEGEAGGEATGAKSSATFGSRRCTKCGVRKALWAFYRHRRGKWGRRPDCKRCANRERARQLRAAYVPRTGRRYRTGRDGEAEAAGDFSR
jgi:hypothetical protein